MLVHSSHLMLLEWQEMLLEWQEIKLDTRVRWVCVNNLFFFCLLCFCALALACSLPRYGVRVASRARIFGSGSGLSLRKISGLTLDQFGGYKYTTTYFQRQAAYRSYLFIASQSLRVRSLLNAHIFSSFGPNVERLRNAISQSSKSCASLNPSISRHTEMKRKNTRSCNSAEANGKREMKPCQCQCFPAVQSDASDKRPSSYIKVLKGARRASCSSLKADTNTNISKKIYNLRKPTGAASELSPRISSNQVTISTMTSFLTLSQLIRRPAAQQKCDHSMLRSDLKPNQFREVLANCRCPVQTR